MNYVHFITTFGGSMKPVKEADVSKEKDVAALKTKDESAVAVQEPESTKETDAEAKQKEMESSRKRVSYCIGLETARNLRQQFSDMDVSLLMEGFQDGLEGKSQKIAQQEVQNLMLALRKQIEMQQRQFISQVAEANKKAGEQFLEENKKKDGITTLPSGLQVKVLNKGTGPSPTILDAATIHYKGSTIQGQVFESTYAAGKPAVVALNKVIQGWAEALQKMRVGDKVQLFVPSYLAYGEAGFGNMIGPNVTLVFELELLGVNA